MTVEWYGKEWPLDIAIQEKIRAHVKSLPDNKREDYIKFLVGHCKYKMTFGETS